MKIVNFGSTYEIYPNDLKTFDELPAKIYNVRFNPMSGFSLVSKSDESIVKEEKIYGVHTAKLEKVMNTFKVMNRSLGVMLSGDKGMGKSLFIHLLSEKALELGMPVIIVDNAYVGITNYIDSIEQECLVLFDEFEKVFNEQDNSEPQSKLLGLFDGMSHTKRIYAITVNDLSRVNSYMINRTGRFHYHLRFQYPTGDELRTYLQDKVEEKYWGEIDSVEKFHSRVPMNYDSLRSIAFELNLGETFSEAIKDLNIMKDNYLSYQLTAMYHNGVQKLITDKERLDMFSKELQRCNLIMKSNSGSEIWVDIEFNPEDAKMSNGVSVVPWGEFSIAPEYDDNKDEKFSPFDLKISTIGTRNMHYAL